MVELMLNKEEKWDAVDKYSDTFLRMKKQNGLVDDQTT